MRIVFCIFAKQNLSTSIIYSIYFFKWPAEFMPIVK